LGMLFEEFHVGFLILGKARATHGDNNDLRHLLLYLGKAKSTNCFGTLGSKNNQKSKSSQI
jgi:hypothetical protein